MRAEIPMRMPLEFMPSRRRRSRGLLTVALALSGTVTASGCATMETVAAEPGVAFDLPLGKTALLAGGTARITFNQVTEDSRCPMDAVCVWAGDAKIQLTVERDGAPKDLRTISIISPNNETASGNLRIRLIGLFPVPRSTESATSRAYIAQLMVDSI